MPINRPKTVVVSSGPPPRRKETAAQSDVLDHVEQNTAPPDNTNTMDAEDTIPPVIDIPPGTESASNAEEASAEMSVLSFVGEYLRMIKQPTQAQIVGLAQAIECDPQDLQAVIVAVLGEGADDEMKNAMRDAGLKGNPGVNVPGDLDSFDYEDINPIGTTNLQDLEVPALKLRSVIPQEPAEPAMIPNPNYRPLLSKVGNTTVAVPITADFLQPMDDDVLSGDPVDTDIADPSPVTSTKKAKADLAPTNHRTGVDDGSTVDRDADDAEQQALINDGDIDGFTQIEDFNNNRWLNDDGLS